jgi:hypothetical protein
VVVLVAVEGGHYAIEALQVVLLGAVLEKGAPFEVAQGGDIDARRDG